MFKRLLALGLLASALAGCGGGSGSSGTTSSTTSRDEMTLTAYFLHDGKVAPARVSLPRRSGVETAGVQALIDGPPAGLQTALPEGIEDFYVTIADGTASVSLHPAPDLSPAAEYSKASSVAGPVAVNGTFHSKVPRWPLPEVAVTTCS